MTASEQRLKEALARAEAQLERQSGVDQAAWRTAEAEFNVRMASQRLQVARDVTAALVLLRGADQLLAGVDTGKAELLRRLILRISLSCLHYRRWIASDFSVSCRPSSSR